MALSVFFKLYAVAVAAFLVIDLIWLGVVAKSFYRAHLGHLLRPDVNWAAAIVFYLVFVAGIIVLAVRPAIEHQSPIQALVLGAVLGLVTYAAYDLTNLATLKDFPVIVAVVDLVWGAVLCSTVSLIAYLASTRIA